jgi:hypothetical protein
MAEWTWTTCDRCGLDKGSVTHIRGEKETICDDCRNATTDGEVSE